MLQFYTLFGFTLVALLKFCILLLINRLLKEVN